MSVKEPQVDCKNSALILWDFQYGIASRAFNVDEITTNAKLLIDAAHKALRPVIYSQHTALPYEFQSKFGNYSLRRRGVDPKTGVWMGEGTRDWEIIKELSPATGDLVMKKHTPSFFVGTTLELLLRNRGVDTLILTGASTEVGIEGTARHGAYLGFIPIVVEDAIGSPDKGRHEASLQIMRNMFPVWKTEDVVRALGAPQ
jgi:nicotinamidase-related amidase